MFPNARALRLATVLPALVLVVGCAKPTPVGKWTGTMEGTGQSTIELTKENTVTWQGSVTAPVIGNVTLDASGTYTLDGEKIAIKITEVKSGGRSVLNLLPPDMRGKLDQNTTWKVDGDTLTLGNSQLTRVK